MSKLQIATRIFIGIFILEFFLVFWAPNLIQIPFLRSEPLLMLWFSVPVFFSLWLIARYKFKKDDQSKSWAVKLIRPTGYTLMILLSFAFSAIILLFLILIIVFAGPGS